MNITSTRIGAYPQLDYLAVGNWAETGAPDCGLTMPGRELAMARLENMGIAAREI